MKVRRPQLGVLVALAALVLASGCGGGGGGGGQGPPPPPAGPTITTQSLPDAQINHSYSMTLLASGGTGSHTWSLVSGSLPPGMKLANDGMLSGAPMTTGSFPVTVQVRDSAGATGAGDFTLRVGAPLHFTSPVHIVAAVQGQPFNLTLTAVGGLGTQTWSLRPGFPLPQGLTMSPSGVISGTPTDTLGFHGFDVQVTDSSSPPQVIVSNFSINIVSGFAVSTTNLPFGVLGQPYHFTMQAVGGTPPYKNWRALGLIANLTVNPNTGEITGTPQIAASGGATVQVDDSSNPPQTAFAPILQGVEPALTIDPPRLGDGAKGAPYLSSSIFIQGGFGTPYTLSLVSGALPDGLSLVASSQGQFSFNLTGTPTVTGSFPFTIQVTDVGSLTATQSYTLHINDLLVMNTNSLPDGLEGLPYNTTLSGTGGLLPYTWQVVNPSLPANLTLNASTGQISGTSAGPFDATPEVVLSDSSNPPQVVVRFIHLKIIAKLRITTSSLPAVAAGAPLRIGPGFVGGTPPYTWSLSTGTLPAGLTLNPTTGEISGTPTTEVTSNFTLRVSDSGTGAFAQSVSRALTLAVKAAGTIGRNDSIATATPLSNGTYRASISPFVDPPTATTANPDNDFYQLTANPGAIVTVEITAQRLNPSSPLDSVIEIVDANGVRLSLCSPPTSPLGPFNQPCLNDDMDFSTLDSKLFLQVSSAGSGPLTFFIHVLDFRGDARPDFIYDITISGAN